MIPFPPGYGLVLSCTSCDNRSAAGAADIAGAKNRWSVPAPFVQPVQNRFEATAFSCFDVKLAYSSEASHRNGSRHLSILASHSLRAPALYSEPRNCFLYCTPPPVTDRN